MRLYTHINFVYYFSVITHEIHDFFEYTKFCNARFDFLFISPRSLFRPNDANDFSTRICKAEKKIYQIIDFDVCFVCLFFFVSLSSRIFN